MKMLPKAKSGSSSNHMLHLTSHVPIPALSLIPSINLFKSQECMNNINLSPTMLDVHHQERSYVDKYNNH